jgi:hypothetical protein
LVRWENGPEVSERISYRIVRVTQFVKSDTDRFAVISIVTAR